MLVIKKRLGKGGTSTPAFQENECAQAAVDFKDMSENGAVYFVAGNKGWISMFWRSFPLFGKEQSSCLDDWSGKEIAYWKSVLCCAFEWK